MRNLNSVEINAISGAVITHQGCSFYVSSQGISNHDFVIIEKQFQLYMDGKVSADQAAFNMLQAGVTQSTFEIYAHNAEKTTPICR
jgi:hypothetical protein